MSASWMRFFRGGPAEQAAQRELDQTRNDTGFGPEWQQHVEQLKENVARARARDEAAGVGRPDTSGLKWHSAEEDTHERGEHGR